MRRILFALTLFSLVVPTSLFAEEITCNRQSVLEELRSMSDAVVVSETPEQHLLFFEIDRQLVAGKDVVELHILLRGESFLSEEIQVVPDAYPIEAAATAKVADRDSTIVELMALYPQQRARLHELAASIPDVLAVISVNGTEVARLPFAELESASAELAETELLPATISTRLLSSRLGTPDAASTKPAREAIDPFAKIDPACEDMCWDEYDRCIEERCEYTYCSYCDQVFEDCLERSCGQCQPDTRTSTNVTPVLLTPTGYFYCVDNYFGAPWNPLTWHELIQIKWKRTVTTTVTHEDCSETVTTQVSYYYTYCYTNTMSACPSRNLWVSPADIC